MLVSSAAYPQSFSVGVKGGVPLADAFRVTDSSRYFSNKAPYVIGPAAELHLPMGISGEVGVLYRNLEYSSRTLDQSSTPPQAIEARTTGQVWEFPFLAKYRIPGVFVRPFISAGISYRRLARLRTRSTAPGSTNQPPELTGQNAVGPTLGGGLEFKVRRVRLSSEIRYTRWGTSSFREALSGFASQLNQADFLLGIAF
jgi:hypothetical protein